MKIFLGEQIQRLVDHVSASNSDKYAQDRPAIDMGLVLTNPEEGAKFFTIGNATKYLARYLATGGEKNFQEKDLLKAAHYILFELHRRNLVPARDLPTPYSGPIRKGPDGLAQTEAEERAFLAGWMEGATLNPDHRNLNGPEHSEADGRELRGKCTYGYPVWWPTQSENEVEQRLRMDWPAELEAHRNASGATGSAGIDEETAEIYSDAPLNCDCGCTHPKTRTEK